MEPPAAQLSRTNNDFDLNNPNFQKELVDKMDRLSFSNFTTASRKQLPMRQKYKAKLCITPPDCLKPFVQPHSFEVNTQPLHQRFAMFQNNFEFDECVYQLYPTYNQAVPDANAWDNVLLQIYQEVYLDLKSIIVDMNQIDDGNYFEQLEENIAQLRRSFSVCVEHQSPENIHCLTDIAKAVKWAIGDTAYSKIITEIVLLACADDNHDELITCASNWIILESQGLLQFYKRPEQHIFLTYTPPLMALVSSDGWPPHMQFDTVEAILTAVYRASDNKLDIDYYNDTVLAESERLVLEFYGDEMEHNEPEAGPENTLQMIRLVIQQFVDQQQEF
jgi:hypothetical protein